VNGISSRRPFNFYQIRECIEEEFEIIDEKFDYMSGIPVFLINPKPIHGLLEDGFSRLIRSFEQMDLIPVLRDPNALERELIRYDLQVKTSDKFLTLQIVPVKKKPQKERRYLVNLGLFIATCFSVVFAAFIYVFFMDPLYGGLFPYFRDMSLPFLIMFYAISVLGILGLHEAGHLVALKKHDIRGTLPYFIPLPFPPLGTLGAIIKQESPAKNRNELFDMGLSGPLVGFVVSVIVLIIGLLLTRTINTDDYINFMVILSNTSPFLPDTTHYEFAQSLRGPPMPLPAIFYILEPILKPTELFTTMSPHYGVTLPDQYSFMHPIAFAGWVGLLLTSLNMMTVGQLDGGHVIRAVFGNKSFRVPYTNYYLPYYKLAALIGLAFLAVYNPIFAFLILALSRFSLTHPGPLNDVSSLSTSRKIAFIGFLIVIVLSTTPGSLLML